MKYKILFVTFLNILFFCESSIGNVDPIFASTINNMVNSSPEYLIKKAKFQLDEKESLMFFKSLLPSLDAGTQVSKSDFDILNNTTTSGYLSSQINLFSGFKDYSRYHSLSVQSQISKLELLEFQSSLQASYSHLLIEYFGTLKDHEIKTKFLKIKKDSMLISKMSFKKGATSKQEYTKALIDYQNSIASHESSKIKLEEALFSIREYKPDFDTFYKWPFDTLALKLKARLAKIPNVYLDSLKLKIKELKLKKSKSSVVASRNNYYPSLDLSFKLSRSLDTGAYDYDKRSVLSLNFPLFSGGQDESKLRASKYEEYFAKMKYDKEKIALASKYEALKGNLLRSLDSLKIRKETLVLSRQLYSDNFKRFKKGRVHINDFHVDQNRLLESEKLFNQGQYSFHKGVISFCEILSRPITKCFN